MNTINTIKNEIKKINLESCMKTLGHIIDMSYAHYRDFSFSDRELQILEMAASIRHDKIVDER